MATIGSLAVNITANTGKFVGGITKAQSYTAKFANSVTAASATVASLGTAAVAAGGAIGVYMIKQQFQAVDAMAKFADRIGISTEKLSVFEQAAADTGVSQSALHTGLEKMTVRISEAAQGTGEAVGALNELGLSAWNLNRMSPDRKFIEISDAISKVSNAGDRARLTYEIFGRSATGLVKTMELGKRGFAEVTTFATKAGAVITREMAAKIEAANQATARMGTVFMGFARQLAVRAAPMVETAMTKMTDFLTDKDRVHSFADAIMRGVGMVIENVIRGMQQVKVAALQVASGITGMVSKLSESERFLSLLSFAGVDQKGLDSFGTNAINADTTTKLALMRAKSEDPASDFAKWYTDHLNDALKVLNPDPPAKTLVDNLMDGALGYLGPNIRNAKNAAKGVSSIWDMAAGLADRAQSGVAKAMADAKAATPLALASVPRGENRILERGTREAALAARAKGDRPGVMIAKNQLAVQKQMAASLKAIQAKGGNLKVATL